MSPLRARAAAAWLAVTLLAGALQAQFVAPEGQDFRNGSTLPGEDDGGAQELLVRLDEALVLEQPAEAVHALDLLRARPGDDLLRFGARVHVPALELAARRVAEAGDGSAARAARDAEARRVADAAARRDPDALLALAVRGESFPSATEAARLAARLYFEAGRFGEALALAERVGGLDELRLAAQVHLPPPEPAPARGPWRPVLSFRTRQDLEPDAPLTLPLDGRDGQLLLVDTQGVMGLDLGGRRDAFPDFDWGPAVLGLQGFVLALPSPRVLGVARSGARHVLPFDVIRDSRFRGRSPAAQREASILAFDLAEGPGLAWRTRASADGASSSHGPVTIAGDRAFSLLFRVRTDVEVSLCAFALGTGELLFETPLARGSLINRFASRRAEVDPGSLDKRSREGAVAVQAGVVHACTGVGVVAAVDGLSGRVLHVFRYDRMLSLEPDSYDPSWLFDTGGWEHEPVRLAGGRVAVAPSDARYLYLLAPRPGPGGHLIREDPIERLDRRQIVDLLPDHPLLGGGEAPAVLATRRRDGRSGLVLLAPDGHVLTAPELLPEGEDQTGPPLRVGDLVLLPTSAGLRQWNLADLLAAPALLATPEGLPAPRAVHSLASGLIVLHPEPDGPLHGVHWAPLAARRR